MTAPVWLIAEREFRAYTVTASFWIALAVGPLFMAGGLGLAVLAGGPVLPIAVAVGSADPALARSATAALDEAAGLEGRRYARAGSADAAANLVVARAQDGSLQVRFSGGFPLSASGRMLVARTLERDAALSRLAADGAGAGATRVQATLDDAASHTADTGALSRFGLVMILWLTLTGSLGMLLQAVVRERANRALEGLLAAARPWQIVAGKLAGVGAVSALVLAAWLGSAGGLAALAPGGAGVFQAVIAGASPFMLARAAALYVLAFGFYGLVTVAVGASARDSASAQNLSRPMFAVLLAAFFAALAAVAGAAGRLAWLVFVPPFTPFMLLLEPPSALPAGAQLAAVGLTLAATVLAGRFAVARLSLSGAADRGPARRLTDAVY